MAGVARCNLAVAALYYRAVSDDGLLYGDPTQAMDRARAADLPADAGASVDDRGGEKGRQVEPLLQKPDDVGRFAIPALWGTLHGLYNYFPEIIPVAQDVDPVRMDVPVFRGTQDLYVALRFNIIGFFCYWFIII